jgi:hypothetical protein
MKHDVEFTVFELAERPLPEAPLAMPPQPLQRQRWGIRLFRRRRAERFRIAAVSVPRGMPNELANGDRAEMVRSAT